MTVQSVTPASVADRTLITINLDQTGDFSTYTFTLVADPGSIDPPAGIDPQLATIDFSFKAGCPTPADCQPVSCCPPTPTIAPDINYLAKDYNGFLQVMLDRLAVLTPAWTETHAADLGVALTEVLAYAADHLSYQQDAVSTEAYLGTARSRISLRRHARLVDYRIGEGRNARTLVCLTTTTSKPPAPAIKVDVPQGTLFYVQIPGLPPAASADDAVAQRLQASTQPVFTSMVDASLDQALNEIDFYTWGDDDCCLAVGATQATLRLDNALGLLEPGSYLIFEEVRGPLTGVAADADPTHRCAVQLTSAIPTTDPLNGTAVTRITWAAADSLSFPLCVSTTESGSQPVSVARGNIVLADHGISVEPQSLGVVPAPPVAPDPAASCACTTKTQAAATSPLPRYNPRLAQSPLTFSVPFDPLDPPASAAAFLAPPAAPVPAVTLTDSDGSSWTPVPDLLSSPGTGPTSLVFVPEIEFDGSCSLRFGDDQHGMAPTMGLDFTAVYRVGNATVGNIGSDTIGHVVLPIGQLPAPSGLKVVGSSSGGNLASGTYSWTVTATNANGETVASNEVSAILTGSNSSAVLSWTRVSGATGYTLYRTSPGGESSRVATITAGSTVSYADTGPAGAPAKPPTVNTAALSSPADISHINQVRNPLPGVGGTDPEDMEHIRQFAPFTYEQQQRCVTEDDYGLLTTQTSNGNIIAARGTLRWTGSWYTAFASIESAPVLALEQLPPPSGLTVVGSSSGGSFAAGTYYWQVTATNANGETIGSSEVSATLSGTASSVALSWTRVAGATGYNVYRGTSAASENTLVASIPYGSTVTHTDTGSAGVPTKPRSVNTADLSSVDTLLADTTTQLDMLRMMGTDVAVEAAVIVGLQIEMEICVDAQHFQGDVYEALTMLFITGDQCNGSTGMLNPANFTFGQTVYASPLIAAAQAVEGVVSATLTTFTRMDAPWVDGVGQGYLTMGRLEIARCDNDPDHLDHGTFTLHLDGGK